MRQSTCELGEVVVFHCLCVSIPLQKKSTPKEVRTLRLVKSQMRHHKHECRQYSTFLVRSIGPIIVYSQGKSYVHAHLLRHIYMRANGTHTSVPLADTSFLRTQLLTSVVRRFLLL